MSSNDALNDEVEALSSIYDSNVLAITEATATGAVSAVLALPNIAYSFIFTFPSSYPDEPPSILGTHHVVASARKGEGEAAASILRDVLGRLFTPGQVCLFDVVEEATPLLEAHHDAQGYDGPSQDTEERPQIRSATQPSSVIAASSPLTAASTTAASDIPPPTWTLSEPSVVNKSTFVARSLAAKSLREATSSISHLLSTNKRVAGATHNITAWRIKTQQSNNAPEIVIQDSDDDGETAAGSRLLHLMQLMDVWNVVVVVTRWYGGVKLGPDRFRCINAVAREALVSGGFVKEANEKDKDKTSGKKGKK
ncbi:hypothetical protein LTR70_008490 [Exophiala xenobiotica]|uniref:RWD domain-containing protein n=1 Tax=Lithohypha guttulata TaxID=1690604 RepID=A0ABR0K490_9EURO|nr:hypothetical protein LTR24_007018 [Lithohypha guttulata]KAK5311921.1 hypothetical protein LTR70_008490 [Exophiala xenobiotica]